MSLSHILECIDDRTSPEKAEQCRFIASNHIHKYIMLSVWFEQIHRCLQCFVKAAIAASEASAGDDCLRNMKLAGDHIYQFSPSQNNNTQ
jgi:hypothetical protein